MEPYPALLSRRHLSVISGEPDPELDHLARSIAPSVRVTGRVELAAALDHLLAAAGRAEASAPKTLDLIGHSTAGSALLRLGDWVLDTSRPEVAAWFRELAGRAVLPRLGVRAIRLLACSTAGTREGRATICALAEILGVEVHGASQLLHRGHYGAHGFLDAWQFLLVEASALRPPRVRAAAASPGPHPCTLDIAALPALPLEPHTARWPRCVATAETTQEILALVRRDAGAPMPDLVAAPSCELALASATAEAYHLAHVVLDGAFVRFFPDGAAAPGVVYPIDDPGRLHRLLERSRAALTR